LDHGERGALVSHRSTTSAPLTALPIRTRCVVGAEGSRSIALIVFCPDHAATIAVEVCERCPRLSHVDRHGEQPAVTCELASMPSLQEAYVGALSQPAVLCARRDTPLTALDDGPRSRVIPVVDESDRYVGAVVQGRSSTPPPPSSSGVARDALLAPATAGDVLEHPFTVHERDDLVTAATTMTSSRARCVPVVNDAHEVVGLLDDMTLLASFARARRA
jgi:CBS domain-containing protein